MKILVTGSSGFVGKHLVGHLKTKRHHVIPLDVYLLNATAVESTLAKINPDGVIHLAAIAAVGESLTSPAKILRNNIFAQLNLLEALKRKKSTAGILIIGSADEYGRSSDQAIDENFPLLPTTPYAVSKIAQDFLGLQYHLSYGLNIIRVRPFNHIGEGQSLGFVVPDFAEQIVDVERSGKSGAISVGNLDAVRDFTDVLDIVKAYELALIKGKPGEVYNLGSGVGVTIKQLLDKLISLSSAKITVKVDPARFRPGDQPKLVCNPQKFRQLTGWQAKIPLETTLNRVLEWWRLDNRRGIET